MRERHVWRGAELLVVSAEMTASGATRHIRGSVLHKGETLVAFTQSNRGAEEWWLVSATAQAVDALHLAEAIRSGLKLGREMMY